MHTIHGHPTRPCQCEHASHFTPVTGHAYGTAFPIRIMERIDTVRGTFEVCPSCAVKCLGNVASRKEA